MPKDINLLLPDGVTINLTQPDPDSVSTTVEPTGTVAINTAVFQGSDKHYEHVFSNLAWVVDGSSYYLDISHGLLKKPSVTVIDSFDRVLIVDVEYIDSNNVKLYSTAIFSGTAYFN